MQWIPMSLALINLILLTKCQYGKINELICKNQ